MNEYIVTCRSYEDLEDLYDDMETPGGSLYIPDREVELVHRRTISRNTHYMLTEEEAVEIRNDERVLACERPPEDIGIYPIPYWTQTGDFNKTSGRFSSNDKNWGLYRLTKNETVSNWGNASGEEPRIQNRDIVHTASGKNVDVVIVDQHANPDHPEFAVNPDGTGGSRVNQFNWYQYNSVLGYGNNGTYTYSTSGADPNGNHGSHVAGTACGNTQGWARDANIYNMAFSSSLAGSSNWSTKLWDYLRHFHKNKSVNPVTGRRNPTVTNHSWGYGGSVFRDWVTSVTYRGTTTTFDGTETTTEKDNALRAAYIPSQFVWSQPARNAATEADMQDAMDDGVILIAAAGNDSFYIDVPDGDDYDNTYSWSYNVEIDGVTYSDSGSYDYHRGSSPGAHPNVICVGSIGPKAAEYKSYFSNWGPRVDIWAPGSDIISAVYDQSSADSEGYGSLPQDPRNSSYHLASISGTSMATPQVCGVIACLLEQEPDLTQAEVLQHLIENSVSEVGDDGNDPNDYPYTSFGSESNNRYLFAKKKRPSTGTLSPPVLNKNRNPDSTGVKFPRVRSNRIIRDG